MIESHGTIALEWPFLTLLSWKVVDKPVLAVIYGKSVVNQADLPSSRGLSPGASTSNLNAIKLQSRSLQHKLMYYTYNLTMPHLRIPFILNINFQSHRDFIDKLYYK